MLASTRFEVSPTVTKDGVQAYVTDRNGRPELWMGDRAIVTPAAFGDAHPAFLFDAVFSPDGRRIAYRVSGAADEAIWISPVTGDPPVRIAREPGGAFQRGPSWSPDGNQVVYYSMREGRYVLVRARVGGHEAPVVIAEDAGTYPRWSPKGDWIAAVGPSAGLTLVKPDGSGRRGLGGGEWLLHGWSDDGSRIFGVKRSGARMVLVSTDVASGGESALADLGTYPAAFRYGASIGMLPLRGFTMTADGRGFVTSILRASGDVWVMTRR
jgi:Tol biopolymer transport system component